MSPIELQNLMKKRPQDIPASDLASRHTYRVTELAALSRDTVKQAEAIVKCSEPRGYIYFFNHFLMTFDPRANPKHNPFILYPFQEDFLDWLHDNVENDLHMVLEKSRDMGATWLVIGYIVWRFTFRTGFTALLGSQKERKTDNRDVDSIFGKVEYLLRNLPKYMLPKDFDFNKHRQFLKCFNPENGNSLIGDSANADFGRQGRYALVFLDEFAFWEYADQAWRSVTGGSTNCAIAVSTPNGTNKFKHLRFDAGLPVFTMHWTLHPNRDQAWYERAKVGKTPEDIAQELDISYSRSVMGRVYPEWEKVTWGEYDYDSNQVLIYSWDFGRTDGTYFVRMNKDMASDQVTILDCYYNRGKSIDFYVPFITGFIDSEITKRYVYTEAELAMIQEVVDKGLPTGTHVGDPDVAKKNMTSDESAKEVLQRYGIHVRANTKMNNFPARRTKLKLLIPRIQVHKNERTEHLNDCMMEARYPDRYMNESVETAGYVNSQGTTPVILPIHDWTSHFRTALEFFAVNEPRRSRRVVNARGGAKNITQRLIGSR